MRSAHLDRIGFQTYRLGAKREKAAVTQLLAGNALRAVRPSAFIALLLFLQAMASVLGSISPRPHDWGSGESCLALGQNSEGIPPAPAPRDHPEQCCLFHCSGSDATPDTVITWIIGLRRDVITVHRVIVAADPQPAINGLTGSPRAPPTHAA